MGLANSRGHDGEFWTGYSMLEEKGGWIRDEENRCAGSL